MEDQRTPAPAETAGNASEAAPLSMEAALQEAEARLSKEIRKGQVVKGKVVFVGHDGVAVDIGTKVEGLIPFTHLTTKELPEEELRNLLKPGDEVEVYVMRVDPEEGQILLSRKRVEAERAWKKVAELYEKGEPIEVVPTERVKGGLVAYVEGLRAFIPASQVDLKRNVNLDEFVGQPIKAKIIELSRKGRIILSRRALLEEEEKRRKKEFLENLEPGQIVEGKVVEVTDFGAFVNLGPVDGLVHRSELSWGRFSHPREVIKEGDVVRAKVISVDPERERVNLSIKAATPNPWEVVSEKYQVGQKVKGKVVGLTPFGAFVEVEPGLEGLIHISEMSWTKRPKHPSEVVKEGEEVEAVIQIEPEEKRLSLGLRQLMPDPWKELPDKYPPGTIIKGKVTGITPFGVFVEIEPGIEGQRARPRPGGKPRRAREEGRRDRGGHPADRPRRAAHLALAQAPARAPGAGGGEKAQEEKGGQGQGEAPPRAPAAPRRRGRARLPELRPQRRRHHHHERQAGRPLRGSFEGARARGGRGLKRGFATKGPGPRPALSLRQA